MRPREELLREKAGQQRTIHLHHVGEIEVDRLVQRGLDRRMPTTECEDAEARQHVEVALPAIVVEVAALAANEVAVETERLEYPRQLRVQVLLVECKVLTVPLFECPGNVERHLAPLAVDPVVANVPSD